MAEVGVFAEEQAGVFAVAGYAFDGCLQRFEFAESQKDINQLRML